jgi:hypothetical protein
MEKTIGGTIVEGALFNILAENADKLLIAAFLGGLAVAAVTSFALSLFHDLDATMIILIWNLGSAIVVASASSLTA